MEPIFSPQAQVVGWYKNDTLFDESGHPRAFVRERAVFALNGQYLGRMEHSYIRDQRGDAVAYLRGAAGAPIPPSPRVIPTAPMTWSLNSLATPRVVPYAATPSTRWSDKDFEVYVSAPLEAVVADGPKDETLFASYY